MKKFDQSADKALSRFAKDSRLRSQAKEAKAEQTTSPLKKHGRTDDDTHKEPRKERRSFNPNFTEDNRPRRATGKRSATARRKDGEEGAERTAYARPGSRRSNDTNAGFSHKDRAEHTENSSRPTRRSSFRKDEARGERRTFNRSEEAKRGTGNASGKFHSTVERGERTGSRRSFPASERSHDSGRRSFGRTATEEKPKSYPRYNPNRSQEEMRLNRFIAQSGMCSRREADEYIKAGLVKVNGQTVTELGVKVKLTDEVRFSDEKVRAEKNVYILLNKPKGYVTTTEDEHADHTVMELVENACKERIYPVGRLDKDSLGLLLFTNDGDITRALTHPSYNKKKIYEVTLDKPLTRADFETLAEGVQLEDGEAYFDQIEYTDETKKTVGVEIHSGRNRIVRRMFDSLGYKVRKLDRVYYAGLTKKNLKRGAWRFLTDDEVAHLKSGRYE